MWHSSLSEEDTIKHSADKPLLQVTDLSKTYVRSRWPFGAKVHVKALDSVSFTLEAGSSIAFVGESGSGKSTLGMCISRLLEADSGKVLMNGTDLFSLSGTSLREVRSKLQLVFQDAATSFNPTFTAGQVICEPMVIRAIGSRAEQQQRAIDLMERVGLPVDSISRSPMQFSGGQRQRLAIARALAADAEVIILDEALSGLDMSVQADIANLLLTVQAERRLALIYISHDMELAGYLADEIAVMSEGRIVERGLSSRLLQRPEHPQTQALINAMLSFESQT
ncbi:MAG: oppF [Candidatus Angelobacter sp.]|nr:oppF [Candidatus Angelobacter sp.]